MLYIGVDLGTSSVKLLLMDEVGQIKSIVTRSILYIFQSWLVRAKSGLVQCLVDGIGSN